jgi:hypothetical protein
MTPADIIAIRARSPTAARLEAQAIRRARLFRSEARPQRRKRTRRWPGEPLLSDLGNGCDIDVHVFGPASAPLVGEVKARGNGEGFALLERWLGDADMLFLRRDRAEPLVVVPWRVWARLLS